MPSLVRPSHTASPGGGGRGKHFAKAAGCSASTARRTPVPFCSRRSSLRPSARVSPLGLCNCLHCLSVRLPRFPLRPAAASCASATQALSSLRAVLSAAQHGQWEASKQLEGRPTVVVRAANLSSPDQQNSAPRPARTLSSLDAPFHPWTGPSPEQLLGVET